MVAAEIIKLQDKEIFNAGQSQTLELTVQSGVLRVGANFNFDNSDVTLALLSAGSPVRIKTPAGCSLQFEALTESSFSLTEDAAGRPTDDLNQWLIHLHLVRQLIGAEARLIALFQLLVEEFGFRHKDTYSLHAHKRTMHTRTHPDYPARTHDDTPNRYPRRPLRSQHQTKSYLGRWVG